jgi:hypothetical protein
MITAPAGSETVTVSRLHASDTADQKIITTTRVSDIIRAVGKLNAAYPDVAQMLVQAEKQSSLPGRLEIDALPQSGRAYYRTAAVTPGETSPARQKVKVGSRENVPNMFPTLEPVRQSAGRPFLSDADENAADNSDRGEASVVDDRAEPEDQRKSGRSGGFLGLFRSRSETQ